MRTTILLDGDAGAQIPLEAPHAVLSGWLDEDHKAAVKPYALGPPRCVGRRVGLPVRLLEDALTGRLRRHAVAGATVRLGRHLFCVAATPRTEEHLSWEDLRGRSGRRAWEVAFRSPTTFRRGSRTSPWPAPDSLLLGLSSRWNALSAQSAPALTREVMQSLWVSDIDGRSEAIRLRGTVVSGFVGRVRYVCDGSEADAGTVDALLAFARFAGIGSHTAFALGTVDVESTWQPSRVTAGARRGMSPAASSEAADDRAVAAGR